MYSYDVLNNALCEALFRSENANKPVYLELNDEVIEHIHKKIDLVDFNLDELIIESVKNLLNIDSNNLNLFSEFEFKQNLWRQGLTKNRQADPLTNYPNIPLLMLFAINASEMGTSGGFNTSAYYPRLKELLEVENKKQVEDSYRKIASTFWTDLNFWLDTFWKGKRGIGTAYSISQNRHVGYALSQALVRSVDRDKLPRLFRENGFSAFTSMVAKDMEKIIDDWAKRDYLEHNAKFRSPSKPFLDLWRKPEARTRIASILCRELEAWDGNVSLSKFESASVDKHDYGIRLELSLNTFPTKTISMAFALSAPKLLKNNEISLLNSSNEKALMELSQPNDGWMRPLVSLFPISIEDLITSVLQVDVGEQFLVERYPKNLIIFRLDDLSRKYHETERLEMGIKCIVLCLNTGDLSEKVSKVLLDAARPGWKKNNPTELHGIPDGWLLFSDVELVSSPSPDLIQHSSLEALKPTFSGSMIFSQGLQLPGRPPKWHSKVPVEIKAFVLGAEKIEIKIFNVNENYENCLVQNEFEGQTAVWPLDINIFDDGDYVVQLIKDDEQQEITEKILRLRSSSTIDQSSWENKEKLIHDLSTSNSAVVQTSKIMPETQFYVDGALFYLNKLVSARDFKHKIDISPWWSKAASDELKHHRQKFINLNRTEIKGCFLDGSHNYELPPATASKNRKNLQRPISNFIDGVCKYCGIRKKFAATPWAADKKKVIKKEKIDSIKSFNVKHTDLHLNLPSVEKSEISWDTLLDAVLYLGGGSLGALESIANNIDTSALFKYDFINQLDQLAYIDIQHDDLFEVLSWEVSPKCLVQIKNKYILTGFWSRAEWQTIEDYFGKQVAIKEEINNTFSTRYLKNIEMMDLEKIKNLVSNVSLVQNATKNILNLLPSIHDVISDLPTKAVPGFEILERYEPYFDTWTETDNMLEVGSYRLTQFYKRRYVVRNEYDLENRTVRYCNAEIAKHYSSANLDRALISYDKDTQSLLAPLGARLPGLYGRALVLASGKIPQRDSTNRFVIYENITLEQAEMISYKVGKNL